MKVNEDKIEICDADDGEDVDDFNIKIEEDNDEENGPTIMEKPDRCNTKIRNTEKIKSILGTSIEYDDFKYNKDQLKKKLLLQKKYI